MCLTGDHGQGAGGFKGYGDGAGVMVHLDYGENKFARGNVEELFLHESAHACLDPLFKNVRIIYNLSNQHRKINICPKCVSILKLAMHFLFIRPMNGNKLGLLTENLSLNTQKITPTEKMWRKVLHLGMLQEFELKDNLFPMLTLLNLLFQIE